MIPFSHKRAIAHIAQELHIPERQVRVVVAEMFGPNVRNSFFDPNVVRIPGIGKFVSVGTKPIKRIKEKSFIIERKKKDIAHYNLRNRKKKKAEPITVEPEPYLFDPDLIP